MRGDSYVHRRLVGNEGDGLKTCCYAYDYLDTDFQKMAKDRNKCSC